MFTCFSEAIYPTKDPSHEEPRKFYLHSQPVNQASSELKGVTSTDVIE